MVPFSLSVLATLNSYLTAGAERGTTTSTSTRPGTTSSAGLIWLFPFTFISSAFVSAASLPGPLRFIAEWNPVTAAAAAARKLFVNQAPPGFAVSTGWPAQHAVLYAALTSVVIIAVFMPLAVAKYRGVSSR